MRTALPLSQDHQRAHTYCTYCPKLCRFSCPVSTAQASETTTPWAKMTSLHHATRGQIEVEATVSASWYACTGCLRCKSHCDHSNEVADALNAGRAAAVQVGTAPKRAHDIMAQFDERQARAAEAGRTLFEAANPQGTTTFAPGCTGSVLRPDDAARAFEATASLTGAAPRAHTDLCCGLPLLEAGDPAGFVSAARRYLAALSSTPTVMTDPGCLYALVVVAPQHGLEVPDTLMHFSELCDQHRDQLGRVDLEAPVRYHDPCRLGRGLGVYEPPRRVLETILGRPVEEFFHRREDALCSGAGGQLPRTDPETAGAIAAERAQEHDDLGGGVIVTACPGSAHQLSKSNPELSVLSFGHLVAQALSPPPTQ